MTIDRTKMKYINGLNIPDEYWIRVRNLITTYNDKFRKTGVQFRRLTNGLVLNGLIRCYNRDTEKDDIFYIPKVIRVKQYKIYPHLKIRIRDATMGIKELNDIAELEKKVNKTKEWTDKRHRIGRSEIVVYLIDRYIDYFGELLMTTPRSQHHLFF